MWISRTGILASSGVDSDVNAVILAIESTGVTLSSTQKTACTQLITELKSYGLWVKIRALYGLLGGTAGAHKFNWKNPIDTNGAYRLTFFGGVTHDANGVTGNGTSGYALTYLPASTMGQNDIHISWRSNTNVGGSVKAEIGQASVTNIMGYSINGAGTSYVTRLNNASNGSASTTTSNGFYQASRLSSANYIMQKDATQSTITSTSNAPTSQNIILMASSTTAEFSNRNLQLVTIGDGLTATEMNNLRTCENNYKTNLGR